MTTDCDDYIRVIKVQVLLQPHGTDRVYLHTLLPSPFPLDVCPEPLAVSFEAQRDKGIEYCRRHFNIEPEVIDARR